MLRCSPRGADAWSSRCQTRPITHVAAEMGVSRACASKRVNRHRRYGELGALARSSTPPGHMVHIDVKKVGRIPDGGGWRVHGRGSEPASTVDRRKGKTERGAATSTCTPQSTATPGSPTPRRCPTRRPPPLSRSCTGQGLVRPAHPHRPDRHRQRGLLPRRSVCPRTTRVTAPGITPYTPRHNGKEERYNRKHPVSRRAAPT